MTLKEVVKVLSNKTGATNRRACEDAWNAIIEVLIEELTTKRKASLCGVANFKITQAPSRKGRNPQTGEAMSIPAKWRVKVKAIKPITSAIENLPVE